jgi:hypothetical protein
VALYCLLHSGIRAPHNSWWALVTLSDQCFHGCLPFLCLLLLASWCLALKLQCRSAFPEPTWDHQHCHSQLRKEEQRTGSWPRPHSSSEQERRPLCLVQTEMCSKGSRPTMWNTHLAAMKVTVPPRNTHKKIIPHTTAGPQAFYMIPGLLWNINS